MKASLIQLKSLTLPRKHSDYNLRKFRVSIYFVTIGDMKKTLAESFTTFISKESEPAAIHQASEEDHVQYDEHVTQTDLV